MDTFKIKVKQGKEEAFQNYLVERNIGFNKYPEPFQDTYTVKCSIQEIVDIGDCIKALEDSPHVALG